MKKLHLFLATAALLGMTACSDDDKSSNNNNTTNEILNSVTASTWRITSFVEEANDETSHFSGYSFKFGKNGTITATNGTNTYSGTWSVTDDDSSDDDDSSSSDVDFNINFTSPNDFTDLSDDWDVLENTDTKIRLIDVSGGNGGTDYLTFEKN